VGGRDFDGPATGVGGLFPDPAVRLAPGWFPRPAGRRGT